MKKLHLSLATLLAVGTISTAQAQTPVLNEFYMGLSYSSLGASYAEEIRGDTYEIDSDEDFSQAMIQAGYKINPYFAFEGRYWLGMSDNAWDNVFDDTATAQVDTWGLYAKLFLPISDSFNLYTLLGYASADYSIEGERIDQGTDAFASFSWGVGTNVSFSKEFGVFIDYVAVYDDTYTNYRGNDARTTIDTVNFGATFTF